MATDTTTNKSGVQKTPGVCGGDACIRNTRITVWGLVLSRRLGASDASILENIVGLTPDDLEAAAAYYRDNSAEIDEAIRVNEEP
jgi:type III restriction enzyme